MKRLAAQDGFGLIETLIALTMVNIALLALVASLNAGAISLARAGSESAANSLAQEQLELYRAVGYSSIALDAPTVSTVLASDTTYACDEALKVDLAGACAAGNRKTQTTISCATPLPQSCQPTRTVTTADGRDYRVDAYVVGEVPSVPSGTSARQVQVVTIVVRDGDNPARELARLVSTFDSGL